MSKRYFFIDNNIYYQNYKMPARKVELFNVRKFYDKYDVYYVGRDEDGNDYTVAEEDLIVEESD